jgi:arsenate reductase
MKKKLLFVCIENSNRSQMAEAFAKINDGGIEAYSAGSKPSGIINTKAVAAMKEIGYDLTRHHSKSLDQIKHFAPKKFVDWDIPDPREMDENNFRLVRDLVKNKVMDLLASL